MDYLPQALKQSHGSSLQDTVLVHATEKESRVQAIVCSKKDGHFFQIWGARTDPSLRGKGLMRGLMVWCIMSAAFEYLIDGSDATTVFHSLQSISCNNAGMRT